MVGDSGQTDGRCLSNLSSEFEAKILSTVPTGLNLTLTRTPYEGS